MVYKKRKNFPTGPVSNEQRDKDQLKQEIATRDYNDSHREFAPLRQAEDAKFIDTSNMTIEEVINAVLESVKG